MRKRCWIARLAMQQHFPIQIPLVFLRFKLLPNFIFLCYRPQTWQLYLVFPALSISAIHEVLGIKCKGVRSYDGPLAAKGLLRFHHCSTPALYTM